MTKKLRVDSSEGLLAVLFQMGLQKVRFNTTLNPLLKRFYLVFSEILILRYNGSYNHSCNRTSPF